MKKIPITFIERGRTPGCEPYKYRMLVRSEVAAVYEQTKKGVSRFGVAAYEVLTILRHTHDRLIGGRAISSAGDEFLPSSESWGQYGFTYTNEREAMRKFYELTHAEVENK